MPLGQEFRISGHSHTFGKAAPTNQITMLVCGCFGRRDHITVAQGFLLVYLSGFTILECNDIFLGDRSVNRTRYQIGHRGRWNAVRNTIAINIPTNHFIGVHGIFRNFVYGLADDLLISARLHEDNVALLVVEGYPRPVITVNHTITVVPSGEIVIPAEILFVALDKDSHAGNIFEEFRVIPQFCQINALGNDDILSRNGQPCFGIKRMIQRQVVFDILNDNCFNIGSSLHRAVPNDVFKQMAIGIGILSNILYFA